MLDLGTLGGTSGQGYAINEAGQIVGYAQNASGVNHPFLYTGGTMQDLGLLSGTIAGEGWDINANGWVVGQVTTSGVSTHGFLYRNGSMVDLNSITNLTGGWVVTKAYGINDNGWIVGEASKNGAKVHAVLLQTPEPATFLVLGVPALLALRRRKARRAAKV
jgi:probable HAF family extracellular repeat protein